VGCKARKTATKETVIYKTTIDTVREIRETFTPIYNTIEILELCDSVNGSPREFSQTLTNGAARLQVAIKNNALNLTLDIDSLARVVISRYRQSDEFKSLTDKRLEIRYKTPSWAWFLLAAVFTWIAIKLKFWRLL